MKHVNDESKQQKSILGVDQKTLTSYFIKGNDKAIKKSFFQRIFE